MVPGYNPSGDVEAIRTATKKMGTDENLGTRFYCTFPERMQNEIISSDLDIGATHVNTDDCPFERVFSQDW